ncbi:response regulator transcription factor [Actinosynnema sp. NPDC050436]|uniref:response regulator transcription factor n=1 Tax=Actinosynnema sp. NPDC050436 TaxID=3155659 RepID=UPI0034094838
MFLVAGSKDLPLGRRLHAASGGGFVHVTAEVAFRPVVGLASRLGADVVVFDSRDNVRTILQTIVELRGKGPGNVGSILVADDAASVPQLLAHGARTLLTRAASREEILLATAAALRGDVLVPAELAPRFQEVLRSPPAWRIGAQRLTPRQRDVLALLAKGVSNSEIAAALSLSEKTVKTHVSNILSALNLTTRTQVVATLLRGDLI